MNLCSPWPSGMCSLPVQSASGVRQAKLVLWAAPHPTSNMLEVETQDSALPLPRESKDLHFVTWSLCTEPEGGATASACVLDRSAFCALRGLQYGVYSCQCSDFGKTDIGSLGSPQRSLHIILRFSFSSSLPTEKPGAGSFVTTVPH